jgi:hypothetical protein
VWYSSTHKLFFIFFGTGFEALAFMQIVNEVWVMTLCSPVHGYECFGGAVSPQTIGR